VLVGHSGQPPYLSLNNGCYVNQTGISSSAGPAATVDFGGAVGLPVRPPPSSPLSGEEPPLRAPPSICIVSPITFNLLRFCPDCLSSQVSSCSRPSIKIGRPFFKYSPATSAVRPQKVTSTKVTSSRFSPFSNVYCRLTAIPRSVTALPFGV